MVRRLMSLTPVWVVVALVAVETPSFAQAGARERPVAPADAGEAEPAEELSIEIGRTGIAAYAVGVDAHEFFAVLARKTGLRLIVDDTVRRKLTVNFTGAKVSEIIDDIITAYGLACSEVDGIFIVSEGIPRTPSSYLLSDIDSIRTQYVLPTRAKALLQDHVKTNSDQNAVILSAPPAVLEKFRQDIE